MIKYLIFLSSMLGSHLLPWPTPVLSAKNNVTKLKLLVLVPFFDSTPDSGWDKGLELLPMGRIARNEINQRKDILPGYELELIEASSDACGYPVISTALVNFAGNAIGSVGNSDVIGVAGLACSTVTANVSPLAGREGVSLIQMSMSNSPDLRNSTRYPHLWRTVASSIVFVNATLALMDKFNWSKISTIFDENGNYFQTTARRLVSEVVKNESRTVILNIAIDEYEDYINSAIDQIKSNGARIIFVSCTPLESALVMCAAAKKDITWPGYQWIFHTRKLDNFVSNLEKSNCEKNELLSAMENVILLQWQLSPNDSNMTVYSGKSVQELRQQYFEELSNLTKEEQYSQYANEFSFKDQEWAYPLYDEVWAFALALNESIPELKEINLSLAEYRFGNEFVTEIIEKHLSAVSFQGTVGHISFDIHHEPPTPIKVYQVRNGTEVLIGDYSKLEGLVIYNTSDIKLPDDDFEVQYVEVPQALKIILYLINSLVILMITSLMMLTIFYQRSPVIKANGALLSSLIFFGCYCVAFSTLARILLLETVMKESYYTAFCSTQLWCWSVGVSLILGTVLMKLGRIYRLFTHFGQTGRSLSNYALFIYVLLLAIFPTTVMLVWSIADTPQYHQLNFSHLDQNPPHVTHTAKCSSQQYAVWHLILLAYFAIMLAVIMFFAFQTRKIKRGHFKDTKKIMFFVFFLLIILVVAISLWIVINQITNEKEYYGSAVIIVGFLAFCPLCLGFLIAPKVLPVFYQHITTGKYNVAPRRRRTTRVLRQTTLQRFVSNISVGYM